MQIGLEVQIVLFSQTIYQAITECIGTHRGLRVVCVGIEIVSVCWCMCKAHFPDYVRDFIRRNGLSIYNRKCIMTG